MVVTVNRMRVESKAQQLLTYFDVKLFVDAFARTKGREKK